MLDHAWGSLGPEYRREGVWGASGSPARYDIDVTPEHIRQARVGDPACCPIALACREARRVGQRLGERNPMADVRVSGGLIHWTHPKTGRAIAVATPARALRWLHDFDDGRPVAPFSFAVQCYSAAET